MSKQLDNARSVREVEPFKVGRPAGHADAVQRLIGCFAGRPDAEFLRSFERVLRDTADRALECAIALEERDAARCAALFNPNHPSMRRND